MKRLKPELARIFKSSGRVAFLGIGSDLRGDDSVGGYVVKELKRTVKTFGGKLKFFFGYTAPENITGEIKKFRPAYLVIIDSAELGASPGSFRIIPSEKIGGISFSSHRMPLKIMTDYLLNSIKCDSIVIGIQPKSTDFGRPLSDEALRGSERLILQVKEALNFLLKF